MSKALNKIFGCDVADDEETAEKNQQQQRVRRGANSNDVRTATTSTNVQKKSNGATPKKMHSRSRQLMDDNGTPRTVSNSVHMGDDDDYDNDEYTDVSDCTSTQGYNDEIYLPPEIISLLDVLEEQRLLTHISVDYFMLDIDYVVEPGKENASVLQQSTAIRVLAKERSSQLLSLQKQSARQPGKEIRSRLLSAHVIQYETMNMPVDTVVSLRDSASGTSLSGGTLLCTDEELDLNGTPQVLFGNSVVFRDSMSGIAFSSIEAVGFNSIDFHQIAKQVPQHDVPAVAKLFSCYSFQRTRARAKLRCEKHHNHSHQCFFLVPRSYQYMSLINRVYIYMSINSARNECHRNGLCFSHYDRQPQNMFQLPETKQCCIIECDALWNAVKFIDDHLVGAHLPFNVDTLNIRVQPLLLGALEMNNITSEGHADAEKWARTWEERSQYYKAENLPQPLKMSIRLRCLVYYMVLKSNLLHRIVGFDDKTQMQQQQQQTKAHPGPFEQAIDSSVTSKTINDGGDGNKDNVSNGVGKATTTGVDTAEDAVSTIERRNADVDCGTGSLQDIARTNAARARDDDNQSNNGYDFTFEDHDVPLFDNQTRSAVPHPSPNGTDTNFVSPRSTFKSVVSVPLTTNSRECSDDEDSLAMATSNRPSTAPASLTRPLSPQRAPPPVPALISTQPTTQNTQPVVPQPPTASHMLAFSGKINNLKNKEQQHDDDASVTE